MRLCSISLAAVLAFVPTMAAHADTVTTFTVQNGGLQGGGTLTGTIVIDVTNGQPVSEALSFVIGPNTYNFNGTPNIQNGTGGTGPDLYLQNGAFVSFIGFPIYPNLIGYTGGFICNAGDTNDPNLDCDKTQTNGSGLINASTGSEISTINASLLATGSVTTPVVPEPSSLALLGTGSLALIGAARRRFAR